MRSSLLSCKVRTRLYAGFLSLVALALLLAGTGCWSLAELGAQIGKLEAVNGNVQRVLTATARMEGVRRAENRYMLEGDAASAADIRTNRAKAAELMADAAAHTISAERLAIDRHVSAQLAGAAEDMSKFVELGRAVSEGRTHLFAGGDALTAATDKLLAAARSIPDRSVELATAPVERAVLLVRINNWRFLATHDAGGAGQFHQAAEQAERALAALDRVANADLRAKIATVRSELESYGKDFDTTSTAISAQSALFSNTLSPTLQAAQAELGSAETSLMQEAARVGDEARASASGTMAAQLAVAAGGMAFGLIVAFLISRSVLRPLVGMTDVMSRLATGDYAIEIPARERSDEIGDMARAVEVFKRNGIQAVELAKQQEAERAAKERRAQRLDELTRAFEAKTAELVDIVSTASTELQATAQSMTSTAGQVTDGATSAASAARQASVNVQTVAVAAEELTASIQEISRQVAQSTKIASQAQADTRRTDEVVQELSDNAQKVGEIVDLISNIAGQTNLLALNATIEAARAGDAGKGFAVVASEVKSLATQTAKATGDIARQIAQIQGATRNAVESIQAIGKTVGEISEVAAAIAAAVEEQGSATQEIARNAQEAASGTQEASANINGVSQGANATGAAADQVLGAAAELSRQAEQLRSEVGHYISGVKAA